MLLSAAGCRYVGVHVVAGTPTVSININSTHPQRVSSKKNDVDQLLPDSLVDEVGTRMRREIKTVKITGSGYTQLEYQPGGQSKHAISLKSPSIRPSAISGLGLICCCSALHSAPTHSSCFDASPAFQRPAAAQPPAPSVSRARTRTATARARFAAAVLHVLGPCSFR